MSKMTKRYYQEDLSADHTGAKWRMMLSHTIRNANFFEMGCGSLHGKTFSKKIIESTKQHIDHLGFSKNLCEIYATKFNYQRKFIWHYVIARICLNEQIKKKLRSYKTLNELALKRDSDIFDPALYHDETPLLWTVTTMGYANLLLTKGERREWRKKGFGFEHDNGTVAPVNKGKTKTMYNN